MKKLIEKLIFIAAAMTAVAANAQSVDIHSTTVRVGHETYTVSSVTLGRHTDVKVIKHCPSYNFFECYEEGEKKYVISLDDHELHYELSKVAAPHEGSHYTVFSRSYNSRHREVWTKVGDLEIEEMPSNGKEGKMRLTMCEDYDIVRNTATFIVYDEYIDFFVDKNVNKMSDNKLKKKYGNVLENEIYSYELLSSIPIK